MEPFQYMEGEGSQTHLTGLDIELLREALSRIGCEARFVEIEWKEQMVQIAAGTLDVALAAGRMPDREEFALFSAPFRRATAVIVVSGNSRLATLTASPAALLDQFRIEGRPIAVVEGRRYATEIKRLLGNRRELIHFTASEAEGFQELARGQVDGLVTDRLTVATVFSLFLHLQEGFDAVRGVPIAIAITLVGTFSTRMVTLRLGLHSPFMHDRRRSDSSPT